MDEKRIEEINLRKLRNIGDLKLIDFHEMVMKILKKRIKGRVTFNVKLDEITITYQVFLNVGRSYYSTINYEEIIRTNFNWSLFCTIFLDNIRDSYLKDIFN